MLVNKLSEEQASPSLGKLWHTEDDLAPMVEEQFNCQQKKIENVDDTFRHQ